MKGSLTGTGHTQYTPDEQEYRVQANINDEAFVYKGYNSLITGVDLNFIPVPKRGQEIRTDREVLRLDPPYDPDEISMSSYLI